MSVGLALAIATTGGATALTATSVAAQAASPGWPADPQWQHYVQSPASTDVRPVSIVSTSGDVTNADALLHPGSGDAATLTATPRTIDSHPVTVSFGAVQARYVRVDVTKLGLRVASDPAPPYVQLAEMQVFGSDDSGATNLALDKPVTASESIETSGWGTHFLTDGVNDSQSETAHGWTSNPHASVDVSGSPVWATIDLGSVQTVDRVVLWPRTDQLADGGQTASFPVDFSIKTSSTDAQGGSFATQKAVTGQADPAPAEVKGGASIVLDYGKEVGGYPTFDVSDVTGTPDPTLQAGYSETRSQISATGDGVTPWASGDSSRFDTYTVHQPGRITNGEIQGGERYEQITLTTPGTISLSSVGIDFTPYLATPDTFKGNFLSSSDELNQYWYDGVYTAQVNQVPANSIGPRWNTDDGSLNVPGSSGGAGLLKDGSDWTDYTVTFDTKIVSDQAGWMLRGQGPESGYIMILDAADDSAPGGPNVLQEVSADNGTYKTIGNVTLSHPVDSNVWHTVKEVISGTTVTTYLDDTQVATFDSAAFGSGTKAFTKGSFGFRQFNGEEADFRNLTIESGSQTLYSNSLSDSAALSDFDVPGRNALPLILDGAKRDRAVWSGDLAVEGPTLYYSTDTSEYIRGSLELLGSWAGSNGYVSGAMPPQTPVNTAPAGDVKGGYSADYSAYFVRNLAEYYLYTGDVDFVRQEWPIVAKELEWNRSLVDENGLMATNDDNGADWDYYDGDKTGEVTAYNALYYQTLLDGAKLAEAAGHPELSAGYTAQAAALKTAINAALFNTTTGVYDLSSDVRGVVAQDANVFAIVFGIAPQDKVAGILAKIKNTLWTAHGTKPYSTSAYSDIISPFISGFELNARLASDNTADALALLSNEWGPMIAPGDLNTGTFWENITTNGVQGGGNTSMAHGWSTMPTSSLSKYVLGIQPVDAGYQTWLVKPHPGDLAWTTGQAPTPHGALVTKWSHDAAARTFAMHVEAPAGTAGTIAVPTFGEAVDITVNGHVVWKSGVAVAGAQGVHSATADGAYVDLQVDAGTYDVATAQPAVTSVPPTPRLNRTPHATPDAAKVVRNKSTKIAVLKNDTDPDGDLLAVASVKRPKHGKVRIVHGKLVYKPKRGYVGKDVFTYTISDGHGGLATARVKVKVVRKRH